MTKRPSLGIELKRRGLSVNSFKQVTATEPHTKMIFKYTKPLILLLSTFLFLQTGMQLLLHNQQLSEIRSQQHQDVELICTGTDMKWISVSQTNATGKFVFVQPPSVDLSYDIDDLCADKCVSLANALLLDHHATLILVLGLFAQSAIHLASFDVIRPAFGLAISRAPPYF